MPTTRVQCGRQVKQTSYVLLKLIVYAHNCHNAEGNAVAKTSSLSSGQTTIHILLGQLDCEGTENSISQCSHDNSYECIRPGAGIICPVQLNGNYY